MKSSKFIKLGVAALLLAAVTPTMVSAAENDATANHQASIELLQGEFTLETQGVLDFGQHKIEAQAKTVSTGFAGDFGVIDARGTQEGWSVTVEATPFTMVEPAGGFINGVSDKYSLPYGSLVLNPLETILGVYGEGSDIYPKGATAGTAIDLDGGGAVKVASAEIGKGMGEYKLTFGVDALELVIDPTTAKIDNENHPGGITPYESTLTWNLVTGP